MTLATFPKDPVYGLWHPNTSDTVSGYGLAIQPGRKDWLVGLLMVDRPKPVDPVWLNDVEATFGGYELMQVTEDGARGMACQMYIEPESRRYVRAVEAALMADIAVVLWRFLEVAPKPRFRLSWDPNTHVWVSTFNDERRQVPDMETLMEWMMDGDCEATDGCIVEPDGTCPHGHKSWLLELGLI
ncbi:MAG: hypothetical protein U0822_08810 [Anaerolineae bacterium]